MTGTTKKVLYLILILLILITVLLLLYKFPKKIDIEYPAMEFEWRDTATSYEETKISIKGTLNRPLFSEPIFTGEIIIDEYDITQTHDLVDIKFFEESSSGRGGILAYSSVENGRPIGGMLGFIWMSGSFDEVVVTIFESTDTRDDPSEERWITAPASTEKEAIDIYKNLLE